MSNLSLPSNGAAQLFINRSDSSKSKKEFCLFDPGEDENDGYFKGREVWFEKIVAQIKANLKDEKGLLVRIVSDDTYADKGVDEHADENIEMATKKIGGVGKTAVAAKMREKLLTVDWDNACDSWEKKGKTVQDFKAINFSQRENTPYEIMRSIVHNLKVLFPNEQTTFSNFDKLEDDDAHQVKTFGFLEASLTQRAQKAFIDDIKALKEHDIKNNCPPLILFFDSYEYIQESKILQQWFETSNFVGFNSLEASAKQALNKTNMGILCFLLSNGISIILTGSNDIKEPTTIEEYGVISGDSNPIKIPPFNLPRVQYYFKKRFVYEGILEFELSKEYAKYICETIGGVKEDEKNEEDKYWAKPILVALLAEMTVSKWRKMLKEEEKKSQENGELINGILGAFIEEIKKHSTLAHKTFKSHLVEDIDSLFNEIKEQSTANEQYTPNKPEKVLSALLNMSLANYCMDKDMLKELIQSKDEDTSNVFDWLKESPFVTSYYDFDKKEIRTISLRLHNELVELLNEYFWEEEYADADSSTRNVVYRKILAYYANPQKKYLNNDKFIVRQRYEREYLDYKLRIRSITELEHTTWLLMLSFIENADSHPDHCHLMLKNAQNYFERQKKILTQRSSHYQHYLYYFQALIYLRRVRYLLLERPTDYSDFIQKVLPKIENLVFNFSKDNNQNSKNNTQSKRQIELYCLEIKSIIKYYKENDENKRFFEHIRDVVIKELDKEKLNIPDEEKQKIADIEKLKKLQYSKKSLEYLKEEAEKIRDDKSEDVVLQGTINADYIYQQLEVLAAEQLIWQGEIKNAIKKLDICLTSYSGINESWTAFTLYLLGHAQQLLGNFEPSIRYLRQARSICIAQANQHLEKLERGAFQNNENYLSIQLITKIKHNANTIESLYHLRFSIKTLERLSNSISTTHRLMGNVQQSIKNSLDLIYLQNTIPYDNRELMRCLINLRFNYAIIGNKTEPKKIKYDFEDIEVFEKDPLLPLRNKFLKALETFREHIKGSYINIYMRNSTEKTGYKTFADKIKDLHKKIDEKNKNELSKQYESLKKIVHECPENEKRSREYLDVIYLCGKYALAGFTDEPKGEPYYEEAYQLWYLCYELSGELGYAYLEMESAEALFTLCYLHNRESWADENISKFDFKNANIDYWRGKIKNLIEKRQENQQILYPDLMSKYYHTKANQSFDSLLEKHKEKEKEKDKDKEKDKEKDKDWEKCANRLLLNYVIAANYANKHNEDRYNLILESISKHLNILFNYDRNGEIICRIRDEVKGYPTGMLGEEQNVTDQLKDFLEELCSLSPYLDNSSKEKMILYELETIINNYKKHSENKGNVLSEKLLGYFSINANSTDSIKKLIGDYLDEKKEDKQHISGAFKSILCELKNLNDNLIEDYSKNIISIAKKKAFDYMNKGMCERAAHLRYFIAQNYMEAAKAKQEKAKAIEEYVFFAYALAYSYQMAGKTTKVRTIVEKTKKEIDKLLKSEIYLLPPYQSILLLTEAVADYRQSCWNLERFISGELDYFETQNFTEETKEKIFIQIANSLIVITKHWLSKEEFIENNNNQIAKNKTTNNINKDIKQHNRYGRLVAECAARLGELLLLLPKFEAEIIKVRGGNRYELLKNMNEQLEKVRKIIIDKVREDGTLNTVDYILWSVDVAKNRYGNDILERNIEPNSGIHFLEYSLLIARFTGDEHRFAEILKTILNYWYFKMPYQQKQNNELSQKYILPPKGIDATQLSDKFDKDKAIKILTAAVKADCINLDKINKEEYPKSWFSEEGLIPKTQLIDDEKFQTKRFDSDAYRMPLIESRRCIIQGDNILSGFWKLSENAYGRIKDNILKSYSALPEKIALELFDITQKERDYFTEQDQYRIKSMYMYYFQALDLIAVNKQVNSFAFNNMCLELQRRILMISASNNDKEKFNEKYVPYIEATLLYIERIVPALWLGCKNLYTQNNIMDSIIITIKMRAIGIKLMKLYRDK